MWTCLCVTKYLIKGKIRTLCCIIQSIKLIFSLSCTIWTAKVGTKNVTAIHLFCLFTAENIHLIMYRLSLKVLLNSCSLLLRMKQWIAIILISKFVQAISLLKGSQLTSNWVRWSVLLNFFLKIQLSCSKAHLCWTAINCLVLSMFAC